MPASAAIYGCQGLVLAPEERDFFRHTQPFGFILFARNCESPDQIRALCRSLRDSVGTEAPILIIHDGPGHRAGTAHSARSSPLSDGIAIDCAPYSSR